VNRKRTRLVGGGLVGERVEELGEGDVPAREDVAVDVDETVAACVQGALRRGEGV
jgi:hypothetical protein